MPTVVSVDILLSAHCTSSADSVLILDPRVTHHFRNNPALVISSSIVSYPHVSIRLGHNSTASCSSSGPSCLSNSQSVTALLIPVFCFLLVSIPLFHEGGWTTKMSNCCVVSETIGTSAIPAKMQDDLSHWTQHDSTVVVTTRSGHITSTSAPEARSTTPALTPLSAQYFLERP